MTLGDILLGLLVATGYFVAALISRAFRRTATGVIIGGVAGIAVSVAFLFYGMDSLFSGANAAADSALIDETPAADAATAPSE